jgi:hypothetical protein
MKATYWTVFVLVIFTQRVSAKPQQHAPTTETCRADAALWYGTGEATEYLKAETLHKSDGIRNPTPVAKLSLIEVKARATEMFDCSRVDQSKSNDYAEAANFYYIVMVDRYGAFIRRHHLMEQLMREDAQGLR